MARPAAALGCSLLLVACTTSIGIADGVVGSGSGETETRTVEEFHSVEVAGGVELEVTVGEATSFEITAQPNLLPILSSDVTDGLLRVRGTESYTAPPRRSWSASRLPRCMVSSSRADREAP